MTVGGEPNGGGISSSWTRGSKPGSGGYQPEKSGGFIKPLVIDGFQLPCEVPQCCIDWFDAEAANGVTISSEMGALE